MPATTYNSRTAEFRADLAELVGLYDRLGFDAASERCSIIAAERDLNAAQRLTLADAVRRAALGL